MDMTLISRDFKWRTVLYRKPSSESFTVNDYGKSIDLVISVLPNGLDVREIVIKSEAGQVKNGEIELETTIYWKE